MSNMVNFVEFWKPQNLYFKLGKKLDVNWPCPIFEYCVYKERIQNVEHGQFCRIFKTSEFVFQVRQIDVNWPCPIFQYSVYKERIQNVEHGQFFFYVAIRTPLLWNACLSSSEPMIVFCSRVISLASFPQPFRGATYLREFSKNQNLYFKLGKFKMFCFVFVLFLFCFCFVSVLLSVQQNNTTTKQQNNKTTKQQNNKTTKQQNNKTTKQQNNKTTKL